jgi:HEAT repeat protein
VNLENDCRDLVRRLCEGDPDAEGKLLEIGPAAIPTLAAAFPGPLTGDTRAALDGTRHAAESGPVVRALTRFGSQAIPFLVVRTADGNPHVRAWATRLLGELPTAEGARAVARRLLDGDEQVRRAAIASARLMHDELEARKTIRDELTDQLLDAARPAETRMAVIEAFTDVREVDAIPILIRTLKEPNTDLSRAAEWALGVLARQDFDTDPEAWTAWWKANSSRHRIEWLIDALMHKNQDVRRSAGDELKSVTKEYFGYYDDLPRKERAAAQARYQEWWERSGKARFH